MASQTLRIAAIGSGPAALYTAQNILKHLSASRKIEIDIYEKLPVPFGLVRYGVAPDHQDVKNVIKTFTDTLRQDNVNFFGNINVGTDVKISELLDAYNCVVLAYGSLSENYLNVPGEKDFKNFISAKSFVSWYNGLPESENFQIDLTGKRAIVIGAGNVSIDIARILLSPIEKLSTTDISAKALETIKNTNKIEHVSIVARRGILNAAFTLKELRELTKIDNLRCHIDLKQFEEVLIDQNLAKLARPRKRITEYMYKLAKEFDQKKTSGQVAKTLDFSFMRTPLEILGNKEHQLATGARFELNKYDVNFADPDLALGDERALNALKVVPNKNAAAETKPADLIVRSIGYKNVNIDSDVPFDKKSGVVPNEQGKVIGKEGLYCTGWIKRGPRGVIVDTTSDAYETAQKLCRSVDAEKTTAMSDKPGAKQIAELLRKRNVSYVDKKGWLRIDEEEVRRGKLVGKPREKLRSIEEMLKVARSS